MKYTCYKEYIHMQRSLGRQQPLDIGGYEGLPLSDYSLVQCLHQVELAETLLAEAINLLAVGVDLVSNQHAIDLGRLWYWLKDWVIWIFLREWGLAIGAALGVLLAALLEPLLLLLLLA